MKRISRNFAHSLVAAAFALTGATQALADVTVGVSLSLTGPTSALGIPVGNQFKLWPKEIAGQKINLIVLDDATDPTKGAANARRFVTEDKVDIIMGSSITAVSLAIAPVAFEAKTAQLAMSPMPPLAPENEKWVYRMPQGFAVMTYPIVEHMKKHGVKTVGFLGYTDAYGEGWLKSFERAAGPAGIKLVAVERFARPDTSVTPQALKLTSANPDAILVVASGSGAAMPHMALVERGYKGKIYQTHAAATPDLFRIGGKSVEGGYVVSGPAVVADLLSDSHPSKKAASDFVAKYEAAYGPNSRNQFAAHAYDALIVMQKALPVALKKAKPGTPEFRTALRDAIDNMGRTIFSHGVMNWTPTDHDGYTNETGVLLQVKGGKFVAAQ